MKSVVVSLALVTVCLPVAAQQFWHDTKFGMSRAQVKTLIGPKLKMDDDDGLTLKNHYFCDEYFDVRFRFKDDKLEQISLTTSVPVGLRLEEGALSGKLDLDDELWIKAKWAALQERIADTMKQLNQCTITEYSAAYGKPVRGEADSVAAGASFYQFIKAETSVKIFPSSHYEHLVGNSPIFIVYALRPKEL